MKIKNFKKTCIKMSVVLLVLGMLIAGVGGAMTGFSTDRYEVASGEGRWYQTIRSENGYMSFGVRVSDKMNIMSIGFN
ncbi:hypothetical protein LJC58_05835 [Lachnospiraceae bacterium OttesenSCG-928-D06]|nr:hypothetical protein [Lachnospiraceae bacterium OttesenSCG-928-D06]